MKFSSDPCGYMCILVTYISIIYSDYAVVRWIVMYTMYDSLWAPLHIVLFNTLAVLTVASHIRAMCSDPGVVPLPKTRIDFSDIHFGDKQALLNKEEWTVCTRCETYRPPRAHHCRICQRCVRRMDHHCPWINNCVGELNQRFFIQFLIYSGSLIIYTLFVILHSWARGCHECALELQLNQMRVFHSVMLTIESALYGLFVALVLHDQYETVANDETLIEEFQSKSKNNNYLTFHKFLFSKICVSPCHGRSGISSIEHVI